MKTIKPATARRRGDVIDYGQYRVTTTIYGPFVEIWIAESAHHAGHWRLASGKSRSKVLAEVSRQMAGA